MSLVDEDYLFFIYIYTHYVHMHNLVILTILSIFFRELGIGIVAYSPLGRGFISYGPKLLDTLSDDDVRKVC